LLRSITRFVTFISCECGETIDAPSSLAWGAHAHGARLISRGNGMEKPATGY
jgi:hypothetical protein